MSSKSLRTGGGVYPGKAKEEMVAYGLNYWEIAVWLKQFLDRLRDLVRDEPRLAAKVAELIEEARRTR